MQSMSLSEFGNKVLDSLEALGFEIKNPKVISCIIKHYQFPLFQKDIDYTVEEIKNCANLKRKEREN